MLVALIPNHSSLCWLVSLLQWSVSPAFNEWLCCLPEQPTLSWCFIADHLLIWHAPKHSSFRSQDPHFGWKSNHSPLSLNSQNYFWGTYTHWGNAPHRIRNIRADTVMAHSSISNLELGFSSEGTQNSEPKVTGRAKQTQLSSFWELRYLKQERNIITFGQETAAH